MHDGSLHCLQSEKFSQSSECEFRKKLFVEIIRSNAQYYDRTLVSGGKFIKKQNLTFTGGKKLSS